ncbi:hypothetical protein HID58_065350 [Brassica napus]|uniref:Uncharacterized protein n=1 Tax=Brassica napus TaxID=3708 RepID=A0ABQ7ZD19_BRANA|nr:hypothetical protein HID58_065350 [Brassica napus]
MTSHKTLHQSGKLLRQNLQRRRGNQANVIRYFPRQASNFAFKGYFKTRLGCSKEKDDYLKNFLASFFWVGALLPLQASLLTLLTQLGGE